MKNVLFSLAQDCVLIYLTNRTCSQVIVWIPNCLHDGQYLKLWCHNWVSRPIKHHLFA